VKFVVHHQGTQKGPIELKEILSLLDKKELEWTDYVYDESKKDWILLLDHLAFADHFKKWKQPEQKKAPVEASTESEWFILRDDNRYGPFSHLEIVKMLQEKKLFEFDFVWNRPVMSTWERIADLPDFKPDRIRAIKNDGGEAVAEVFFRRRHARAQYGASILLHNNKELWRGHSMEVSSGGAGLVIESDEVQVGQSLFLHFKAGDGVPPFNAVCTIVSKHAAKGKEFRYGVKFTTISQSIQQAIKKFTDKAA
jgi:hypothetical protein